MMHLQLLYDAFQFLCKFCSMHFKCILGAMQFYCNFTAIIIMQFRQDAFYEFSWFCSFMNFCCYGIFSKFIPFLDSFKFIIFEATDVDGFYACLLQCNLYACLERCSFLQFHCYLIIMQFRWNAFYEFSWRYGYMNFWCYAIFTHFIAFSF